MNRCIKLILLISLIVGHLNVVSALSNNTLLAQHLVVMRTIGHELLMASGDTSSLVKPIKENNGLYKIEMDSTFSFQPEQLSFLIDSIMAEAKIANSYIVEVLDCDSAKVVYSYEQDLSKKKDALTCIGRPYPENCYSVVMRMTAPYEGGMNTKVAQEITEHTSQKETSNEIKWYYLLTVVLFILLGVFYKNRNKEKGEEVIRIGQFQFDHRYMTLIRGEEKIVLTGKESELLKMLYDQLNQTVDRDSILREVWRDEGVYVGRTLDVYISKLRKRFEEETSVQFINVRGVGYKMTIQKA